MSTIIYLNLEQIMLYGYQQSVSDLKVEAIMRGIEAGDVFPPVLVRKRNEKEYELGVFRDPEDKENYGGHHRAVAHYIGDVPLRCKVWEWRSDADCEEYNGLIVPTLRFIKLGDIALKEDREEYRIAKGMYKRDSKLTLTEDEERWR
ncbi:hypothetical protein HYT55_04940 [Candidatus Woesearchaeota archaeon]|nr:hypothetical protein [Candidatus Woesearchaeota archaeon]